MEASAAWAKIQAERTAWAEQLPENLEGIFPWLLAQEQATVLRLLTFVVAVTVTGIYGTEPERQSNEALARALGLDMSQWWTATGSSYFNHVSKGRIVEVVTEAVDANAASPLAALKKDAGDGGGTDGGRHGLVAHLPAHQHRPDQANQCGSGRHGQGARRASPDGVRHAARRCLAVPGGASFPLGTALSGRRSHRHRRPIVMVALRLG